MLYMAPPSSPEELPLTVQSVSVVLPQTMKKPPAVPPAEFPLTVQSV
jgi:hypothetical protein